MPSQVGQRSLRKIPAIGESDSESLRRRESAQICFILKTGVHINPGACMVDAPLGCESHQLDAPFADYEKNSLFY